MRPFEIRAFLSCICIVTAGTIFMARIDSDYISPLVQSVVLGLLAGSVALLGAAWIKLWRTR